MKQTMLNELNGKNVLVIGGAGFIGSHLVETLVESDVAQIIVYDNFSRGVKDNLKTALRDPRVKIFELGGDINQYDILEEAIKGKDYVFHLAALWLLHCYDYPRSAFQVNIEGTMNILELCVKHGIKKLIYSSSASVYGDAIELPMTEEHPYQNQTFYGATKIAGEHLCRAFYHRYGLDYVGLRYMNVYGDRQDYKGTYIAVIMKMLDRIDQGLAPMIYGDGSQAYDFIYVKDVARANLCALQSQATDEFFNVGSGVQTSLLALTDKLLTLTNPNLTPQFESEGQTFVKNRIGCTKKASELLGFRYQVELEEGLKKLIAWRKNEIEAVKQRREAI